MKNLLKVLLPPFIGFALYFIAIRYSPGYFALKFGQIGSGTLAGFKAYYRFALPLLYTIAVLTQLLIIVPVWNHLVQRSAARRLWIFFFVIVVCSIMAAAISYAVWDEATGEHRLIKTFVFMDVVQLVYWAINFLTLMLID